MMRHHFMNGGLSMPSFGQQMLNTHPYPLIMAPVMNFEVKVKQEIKVGGGDSTARASILGPFEEGMHHGDVKGIVVEHGLPFVADAGGHDGCGAVLSKTLSIF
jgi:hypothetical protein